MRQPTNKAHVYPLPFLLENRQPLKQTAWSLMLDLHLLITQATRKKVYHISLHATPPIMLSQNFIHLSYTKENKISRAISLTQDRLHYISNPQNKNMTIKSKGTLRIYDSPLRLTSQHLITNDAKSLILKLAVSNLLKQRGPCLNTSKNPPRI